MRKMIFATTHYSLPPTLPPVADGRGQSPTVTILLRRNQAIGFTAGGPIVLTTTKAGVR